MTNIGIVSTWFERGAAYVSRQYMEILQKKFNVHVYARAGESYAIGDPKWDLPNVYWSKKLHSPFVVTVIDKAEFTEWILKNKIEVVLFNEQHWWMPLVWCKELGVKTVAYIDYYTEQTVPLFEIYDQLICNTKKHFDAFKWHQGAKYIPWGTDTELFRPKEKPNHLDKVVFFHSCGMDPHRKGTDILIQSIPLIQNDQFRVIIHTQKSIISQFPHLKDLTEKLISENKLEIVEKTVSSPGLFYLGDIYVYPSRLEGIGLTIVEAIASGLGIVVPDCGPMNEFVNKDFGAVVPIEKFYARADGYFWPQNDTKKEELSKVMLSFLQPGVDIKRIKASAREYAVENHNWGSNSIQILDLFSNACKMPSSRIVDINLRKRIESFENYGVRKYNKYYLLFPKAFHLIKRK